MVRGLSYIISMIILIIIARILKCSDFSLLISVITIGFMNVLFVIEKKRDAP